MQEFLPRQVHFIGIGGTGMSGLAKIMLEMGYQVTGSDLASTAVTQRIEALGGTCYIGHRKENIKDTGLVVISSAINEENPELLEAGKRGVPVIHRADLLAWLMCRKKGLAVAGAHGKTTTSSMLAMVLENNGLNPTIVVGGELNDLGANAKLGSGEYLVAESDESDGSFLKLDPLAVIVTNIEDDHLNYYGSIDSMKAAFSTFLNKIPEQGIAVVCLDDPYISEIIGSLKTPLVTYGFDGKADYTLRDVSLNAQSSSAEVYCREEYLGRLELSLPGKHNLFNALAVVALGCWLGLDFEGIADALRSFGGVGRRFEVIGDAKGVKIIDDYAHHPTEIAATLKAARQVHGQRLIAVFQPHRYTRTALLKERFGEVFGDADLVLISEIYGAGEKKLPGVTAGLIIEAVEKNTGKQVIYCPALMDVVNYLLEIVQPGDLVMTLGAGDIYNAGIELANRLKGN